MLASLLFPYDDDAPKLLGGWLDELEGQNCIVRYETIDGSHYIAISRWTEHQKIDKPSESKIPGPNSENIRERSRKIANPLEHSSLDQGSRIKDQGEDQGEDQGRGLGKETEKRAVAQAREKTKFVVPTLEEVREYVITEKLAIDPDQFYDYYQAQGWVQSNGRPIKDWKAAARKWARRDSQPSANGTYPRTVPLKTFAQQRVENTLAAGQRFVERMTNGQE